MGLYQSWKKLVRSKVGPQLEARGIKVVRSKIADFFGRDRLSREKVFEEAKEVLEAKTREDLLEEIADLTSWRNTLMGVHKISEEELAAAMADKDERKGTTDQWDYLESTEEPDASDGQQH